MAFSAAELERIASQASEEQLAAITAPVDKAVRVLAGPGAGKTSVISWRYNFLLKNGATPDEIVAVTYSKDMSKELLKRIGRINPVLDRYPQAARQICTIHALCSRMLAEEGDRREVAPSWKVRRQFRVLAEQIWPNERQRPAWTALERWLHLSKADGLMQTPGSVERDPELERYFGQLMGPELGVKVAEARVRFDVALRMENLLTFDDMLLDVENRLKSPSDPFGEKWRRRIKWVIIDEGQDTSAQAMRILIALSLPEGRVFGVGDPDQTLFRFAGGAPEFNLIGGFEQNFPSAVTVKLTTNYRCTRQIVATQMRLIEHNYHRCGGATPDKYLKELKPRRDALEGEPVTFTVYATAGIEAEAVVSAVQRDNASGRRKPRDFYLAARTRAQLAYLEGALAASGLPYVNIAGSSFWLLPHVQDVVAYLALAVDTSDPAAFKRVHNIPSSGFRGPSRYLGTEFMKACDGAWAGMDTAVAQNRRWERGVADLRSFVYRLQGVLRRDGLPAGVRLVLDECYYDYMTRDAQEVGGQREGGGEAAGDTASDDQLAELEVLEEIAQRFETAEAMVQYAERIQRMAEQSDRGERVIVSTIHRLKGQQNKVVYGVGWSEGESAKDEPVGLLPHTYSLRDERPVALADERCVAFVLLSRAQEECHISSVDEYRDNAMRPSRFVREAGLLRRRLPASDAELDGDEADGDD